MLVRDLALDRLQNGQYQEVVINHPELDDIEAAVRGLDGESRTLVTLGAPSGAYLAIGGGNCGNYVVSATLDDERVFTAVAPRAADHTSRTIRIVTGGQAAEYDSSECVDLQTALSAARAFAIYGILDGPIEWIQQ